MVKHKLSTDYEVQSFKDQSEWEHWLTKNHATVNGLWVQFYKKGSQTESVNYTQALEVALCYGWIDGQSKSVDETSYVQKFTPRRARSLWSKRNVERVNRLIAEGRMQPAGLAQIEQAKADGRFDQAYDPPSTMQIPEDFLKKLQINPEANAFFATLNKTNLYAIAWRIQTAKREETRQKRIEEIIKKLEQRDAFHP